MTYASGERPEVGDVVEPAILPTVCLAVNAVSESGEILLFAGIMSGFFPAVCFRLVRRA